MANARGTYERQTRIGAEPSDAWLRRFMTIAATFIGTSIGLSIANKRLKKTSRLTKP